jgi:putative ABC transport system ATP-binding protein
MSVIKMVNIKKVYHTEEIPITALLDINIEAVAKSFISFIGPSGSGKTTLLNLIGCIDKPTEGEIFINDIKVDNLSKKEAAKFRGENIGFIFQSFNLIPVLTVYENVEYPLVMVKNVPKKERKDRILNLLAAVEMTDQKNKYPNQISGGQKQRVSIARALVTNPKLVLADEPTANLDHKTAFTIITVMHQMKDEFDTTFIFSTHDSKIISDAEVIYELEDGRIKS